ncbi:MAG: hypothetical protein AVDCRST_MAG93-4205 [uncultured Chloroflexia bacterium]|uniref:Uncharacterized protein n=1 Tax=uncultured Chloroflexia bacterium TaxID=1672391 RepID=A0A6J4K467_9CHLR|nr:MAG: hypothetical protein AVDCRST_MAG93-4205 [uncultured Chloroflexia bacterium]
MDGKMRHDKAGKYAAADETEAYVDKAADDELSDAEVSEADGGLMSWKKPDEDAGPDGIRAR